MSKHTALEERLYDELSHALAWLENLAAVIGDDALVDSCPNNWGGRVAIRAALEYAEAEHPDLANFQPGEFITDGCVFAVVTGRGMLNLGKRAIPAYRVDLGGGREGAIPCQSARRAA